MKRSSFQSVGLFICGIVVGAFVIFLSYQLFDEGKQSVEVEQNKVACLTAEVLVVDEEARRLFRIGETELCGNDFKIGERTIGPSLLEKIQQLEDENTDLLLELQRVTGGKVN